MMRIIGCTTAHDRTAKRGIRSSELTRRKNSRGASSGWPAQAARRVPAVVAAGGERGGSCGTRTGSSCQSNANPRTRTDGTGADTNGYPVYRAQAQHTPPPTRSGGANSKQWRSGVAAFLGAGYRVSLVAVVFVAETTGRALLHRPARLAAVAAELVVGRSSFVTTYQRPPAPAAAELLAGSTSATGD